MNHIFVWVFRIQKKGIRSDIWPVFRYQAVFQYLELGFCRIYRSIPNKCYIALLNRKYLHPKNIPFKILPFIMQKTIL